MCSIMPLKRKYVLRCQFSLQFPFNANKDHVLGYGMILRRWQRYDTKGRDQCTVFDYHQRYEYWPAYDKRLLCALHHMRTRGSAWRKRGILTALKFSSPPYSAWRTERQGWWGRRRMAKAHLGNLIIFSTHHPLWRHARRGTEEGGN